MNKVWSEQEEFLIRAFSDSLTDKELAVRISELRGEEVKEDAVRKKRRRMGIVKAGHRGGSKVINLDSQPDLHTD